MTFMYGKTPIYSPEIPRRGIGYAYNRGDVLTIGGLGEECTITLRDCPATSGQECTGHLVGPLDISYAIHRLRAAMAKGTSDWAARVLKRIDSGEPPRRRDCWRLVQLGLFGHMPYDSLDEFV